MTVGTRPRVVMMKRVGPEKKWQTLRFEGGGNVEQRNQLVTGNDRLRPE
jgi:hypothetical protein